MYQEHILAVCEKVGNALSYTVRAKWRLPKKPKCEVYVEEIRKRINEPWLLDVAGTAVVNGDTFDWETVYDTESGEWQPVRYMLRNRVFFALAEEV